MRAAATIATMVTLVGIAAASASAQGPAPEPPPAQPATPDATAEPAPAQALDAQAEPEAPAEPAPQAEPARPPEQAAPTPPAAPEEAAQPGLYPPLGATPEQQEGPGDWDPWDHPEAFDGSDHTGFFLRLALGFGYGNVSSKTDGAGGDGPGFTGGAFGFDVAIGGSMLPNFAIHGEFFGVAMPDPIVRNGNPALRGADVQLGAFGVGLTYHVMPANLYLSGAIGLGTVAFERNDATPDSTRLGLAANVMIGKEWWVDSQWGVGVAGQLMFVTASDQTYEHVNGLAPTLLFSATYN